MSIHPVGIPSVSTQIAALRHLLLGETTGELKHWVHKVKQVRCFHNMSAPNDLFMMPVNRVMSLLWWKSKVRTRLHPSSLSRWRSKRTSTTRSKSRSSVPPRRISSPGNSDKPTSASSSSARGRSPMSGRSGECKCPTPRSRGPSGYCCDHAHPLRRLPGPPLSETNAIAILLAHNVTVGVGVEEAWMARNTRLDIAWVSPPSNASLPPLNVHTALLRLHWSREVRSGRRTHSR